MLYRESKEDEAFSHLKRSIEIDANHAESHFYMAMILRNDEDTTLAKSIFEHLRLIPSAQGLF